MNIALDTFSYFKHFGKHWYIPSNPRDIKWFCEHCLKLGIKGLHIDPYHLKNLGDLKWVEEFAKQNNMYMELGACGTSYDELAPYIEAAEEYNIKVLRTFVGGSCLDKRHIIDERTENAIKNLPKALKSAEKADVLIALENHGDIFIEDLKKILEIDSDNLGICYDSGNFAFTGEDPIRALKEFKGKIFCTHLKDVCSLDKYPGSKPFETIGDPVHFCALGTGWLPLDKIIDNLIADMIENITLEICTPVIPNISDLQQLTAEDSAVKQSISYLNHFPKKVRSPRLEEAPPR